jgi:hypothetical protein
MFAVYPTNTSWLLVDVTLVRLNTSSAPQGSFTVRNNRTGLANSGSTEIGYDAVVCFEQYDATIVQVYNTTTGTQTTKVIALENDFDDGSESQNNLIPDGKSIPFLYAAGNSLQKFVQVSDIFQFGRSIV